MLLVGLLCTISIQGVHTGTEFNFTLKKIGTLIDFGPVRQR